MKNVAFSEIGGIGLGKGTSPTKVLREQLFDEWVNSYGLNNKEVAKKMSFEPTLKKIMQTDNDINVISEYAKKFKDRDTVWFGELKDAGVDEKQLLSALDKVQAVTGSPYYSTTAALNSVQLNSKEAKIIAEQLAMEKFAIEEGLSFRIIPEDRRSKQIFRWLTE